MRRSWTTEDDQQLLTMIEQKLTYSAIARKIDRTPTAVWSHISKMRKDSAILDGRVRQRQPRRPWLVKESELAYELWKSGVSYQAIAERLKRNAKNVQHRIMLAKADPKLRAEIIARKAAQNRQRIEARASQRVMNCTLPVSDAVETDTELLREREIRRAAQHRDLTGMLLGDPPIGFSALDRQSDLNGNQTKKTTSTSKEGHCVHDLRLPR